MAKLDREKGGVVSVAAVSNSALTDSRETIIKNNFNPIFDQLGKLEADINQVISDYDGDISLAAAIGVLDIIKFRLLASHSGD